MRGRRCVARSVRRPRQTRVPGMFARGPCVATPSRSRTPRFLDGVRHGGKSESVVFAFVRRRRVRCVQTVVKRRERRETGRREFWRPRGHARRPHVARHRGGRSKGAFTRGPHVFFATETERVGGGLKAQGRVRTRADGCLDRLRMNPRSPASGSSAWTFVTRPRGAEHERVKTRLENDRRCS